MRKKTNRKKMTIWEKYHKMQNFHSFAIYRMADTPISDTESESESSSEIEEECTSC